MSTKKKSKQTKKPAPRAAKKSRPSKSHRPTPKPAHVSTTVLAAPRKPAMSRQASPAEQAKGVPANGHVLLTRYFTAKDWAEIENGKKIVSRDLPADGRPSWASVIQHLVRNYKPQPRDLADDADREAFRPEAATA